MEFTVTEKLAIVKALSEMAAADGEISHDETNYMMQLADLLSFDENYIPMAHQMRAEEAINILRSMTHAKKDLLVVMMREMAHADGHVDDEEMGVFAAVLKAAGIID